MDVFFVVLGLLLLAFPIMAIAALVKTIGVRGQLRQVELRLAALERGATAPAPGIPEAHAPAFSAPVTPPPTEPSAAPLAEPAAASEPEPVIAASSPVAPPPPPAP
ncbi:MAG: hypothetical protein ACXU89_20300, partial [Xanthobacteraceae bacterium]